MRPFPGWRQGSVRKWFTGVMLLVLLVLVALAAVSYTLTPSLLEERVALELKSSLNLSKEPGVSLEGDSTLDMLSGSFTGGRVVLEEPELAGVRPERVVVTLPPFDLKMPGSLFGGLESADPLSGDVRLVLSEGEVGRLLSSSSEGPSVESVRLEDGRMTIESRPRFLSSEIPVRVGGDLRVRDEKLVFRMQGIEAFSVDLSDGMADGLLGEAGLVYPLKELPADGEVKSVEISDATLVLSGNIENIPLD